MTFKPGIHDLSVDVYHADTMPPEPSLSHSGIVTLLNETPAHFKARNPRLTDFPDQIEKPTRAQTLGSIVHRLVLGKGHDIKLIEGFDSYRKSAAQELRDQALADGQIPCLAPMYEQATAIAEKATERLRERFGGWPIGDAEVPAFWKRKTDHGEIWCRMLADIWSKRACTIVDLTTTGLSLADEPLAKQLASIGKDIQAAWYLEGAREVAPDHAGLWQFVHVVQEVDPPFATRFVTISDNWLTRVRFRINNAANTFAKCLRANDWPGWPADVDLNPPAWLENKWLEAELGSLEGSLV